jgi:hypothetical protein
LQEGFYRIPVELVNAEGIDIHGYWVAGSWLSMSELSREVLMGGGCDWQVSEVLSVREGRLWDLGEPSGDWFRLEGGLVCRPEGSICCLVLIYPDGGFVPGFWIEVIRPSGGHCGHCVSDYRVKSSLEFYHYRLRVGISRFRD